MSASKTAKENYLNALKKEEDLLDKIKEYRQQLFTIIDNHQQFQDAVLKKVEKYPENILIIDPKYRAVVRHSNRKSLSKKSTENIDLSSTEASLTNLNDSNNYTMTIDHGTIRKIMKKQYKNQNNNSDVDESRAPERKEKRDGSSCQISRIQQPKRSISRNKFIPKTQKITQPTSPRRSNTACSNDVPNPKPPGPPPKLSTSKKNRPKSQKNPTEINENSTEINENYTEINENPTEINENPTEINENPTEINKNPTKKGCNSPRLRPSSTRPQSNPIRKQPKYIETQPDSTETQPNSTETQPNTTETKEIPTRTKNSVRPKTRPTGKQGSSAEKFFIEKPTSINKEPIFCGTYHEYCGFDKNGKHDIKNNTLKEKCCRCDQPPEFKSMKVIIPDCKHWLHYDCFVQILIDAKKNKQKAVCPVKGCNFHYFCFNTGAT